MYVLQDNEPEIGHAITLFILKRMAELDALAGSEDYAHWAHSRVLDELCGVVTDPATPELDS